MVYRKIFTTGLDSRTHTHTHTHTYVHTTFHKGTRTGFLTFFCLSLSHAHAHTHTHTKKHGRWWCSGCFGPWRRRHSNHSALTSSSGVQEERQTDTHCLCLFHFKLYYGNQLFIYLFFFKRNTLRLPAHTHSVDAVLAEGSFIGTFFACRRQRAGTFSDYLTGAINTHMQLTVLSVSRHVQSASAPV